MNKIIVLPLLCSFLLANELDILNEEKKELRKIGKDVIIEEYNSTKDDWIGTINLNSNLENSYDLKNNENGDISKNIGLSFSQSIYESGGIEYSIEYAKQQLNSDLLAWENENYTILQTVYETLLNIKKLQFQITQGEYTLKNLDIELILKRIQYEAGKTDIIELNNAVMSKNNQIKENISLKNSLKEQEYELSKYTNFKSNEIKILDFKIINKEKFIKENLDIKYEDSKVTLLNISHKQLKASYLPKVTVSTSTNYQHNESSNENSDASFGLNFSMPIFDITKEKKNQKSKLEVLKQKININDLVNQLTYEYEQILTQIDTYDEYEKTIKQNLKLYDDLIMVNKSSNDAGMTSAYDLEILQNTKNINEYDLQINEINKKLQYTKLYFKTKVSI